TPTPALRAISSIPACSPASAKTASAASRTRARLRRASARSCLSTGASVGTRSVGKRSVDNRDPYSVFWLTGSSTPVIPSGRRQGDRPQNHLSAPLVDARGLVPEPGHRLRRQLQPQRGHPGVVEGAARHHLTAAMGGGDLLAGVRRA